MARAFLTLAVVQAALMYVPPLSWPMWLAHFVALETCLLGVVTGLTAAWFTTESWVRWLGLALAVVCSLPGLLAAPHFLREGVSFSPLAWVGVGTHQAKVEVDAELLRDALLSRNRSVRTLLIPLADHGFDVRTGGFGEQLTRGVLLQFLRHHLAA